MVLSKIVPMIFIVAAIPCFAAYESVSGPARVIDGDTLVIAGTHIRLSGIDAPEHDQFCQVGTRSEACGASSTAALSGLIAGRAVACTAEGQDRFGRTLATCSAGGIDLNREMVRRGWAVAYRRYSLRYTADEDQAKAAHRGLWGTQFELPEDFRHRHDLPSAPVAKSYPDHRSTAHGHGKPCGHSYIAAGKTCHK